MPSIAGFIQSLLTEDMYATGLIEKMDERYVQYKYRCVSCIERVFRQSSCWSCCNTHGQERLFARIGVPPQLPSGSARVVDSIVPLFSCTINKGQTIKLVCSITVQKPNTFQRQQEITHTTHFRMAHMKPAPYRRSLIEAILSGPPLFTRVANNAPPGHGFTHVLNHLHHCITCK